MQQIIDALEAERAEVQERLTWLDRQLAEFRDRQADHRSPSAQQVSPAPRSVRRATAQRASARRSTARQRRGDLQERIGDYLKDHPQSTAGDVAKGLNANRNTIATRLSQMVKQGDIAKAEKGYVAKDSASEPSTATAEA
jgi:predicted transcriptional regulator